MLALGGLEYDVGCRRFNEHRPQSASASVVQPHCGSVSLLTPSRFSRCCLARRPASCLTPRSRVLDAGCGAGVPIAQRLATHATVVGVDFADAQLDLAKRHVPTGLWVCADLVALPFADASFDAVCSYYAIIHIPREQHASVLHDLARVLRPRGLALLCLGAVDLPAWTEQYYDAPMY